MASSSEGNDKVADDDPPGDTEDDYMVVNKLSLHKEKDRWELKYCGQVMQLPEEIGTSTSLELNKKEYCIETTEDVFPFSIKDGLVFFEEADFVGEDVQGDLEKDTCAERKEETPATVPDHRDVSHDQETTNKPGQPQLSPTEQHNPSKSGQTQQKLEIKRAASCFDENRLNQDASSQSSHIDELSKKQDANVLSKANVVTGSTTMHELQTATELANQGLQDAQQKSADKQCKPKFEVVGHDGGAEANPLQNVQRGSSACQQKDNLANSSAERPIPVPRKNKNEDEVDGIRSDNPSMYVTMSDEYTLDDGNDSDGNVTDSSTDSETTLGRGIPVIVNYKNKLGKKLQDFKKPLYIPLTLEKYLKWQYITNNRSLLQQRMAELANITENVTMSDDVMEVFLRRQKEDYDFDKVAKTLEETLLSDTDSIAVSWFLPKASHPGTEFLQVLNRVVQHSDIGNELTTEMTDTLNSKVIRFVHDVKYLDKAKEITNQAVQEFEKKILLAWHSININLPIVYSHIFEKYDMKRRVRTVSPTVLVFFNIIESKDEFNVELRGQQKDLNRVRKWIEEVFINPYCCLELGFGEVQTCEESIDIPSIIMNTLERKNYQDLFWTINNHSKKTWICSSKSDDAHEAVQVVKTCVKQTKECKKTTKTVEEIESIVEELVAVHRDILGRSVSVRVLTEDNTKDLAIYLTGEEHQLDRINNWFDSYMQSTTGMDSYAATKQDADLTPGSDQKRTQSDPTIGSMLIPGPSQASSPIIPATEEAIVEDPLTGLPPKLPPKDTGSPKRYKPIVCDVDIRRTDDTEYLPQPEACTRLKTGGGDSPSLPADQISVIKCRIQEILKTKINGLWSTRLPYEYKEKFKEDPPDNLIEITKKWPDVARFEVVRNTDRTIVFPAEEQNNKHMIEIAGVRGRSP